MLVATVLTLLRWLPTGLHAPQPTSGGSSLWAGIPTVSGEPDPQAAGLRKALLSVLRRAMFCGYSSEYLGNMNNGKPSCTKLPG